MSVQVKKKEKKGLAMLAEVTKGGGKGCI